MLNNFKISDSEWEIMKIIWSNPNCTAMFVIEKLKNNKEWKPKTVKTLIRRLVDKGAISYTQDGREYRYYSLIDEKECKIQEGNSFIERVYNGSIKAMMLNFIESENLSKKDIEDLRNIFNKKE